jgi:hypothetical protein
MVYFDDRKVDENNIQITLVDFPSSHIKLYSE